MWPYFRIYSVKCDTMPGGICEVGVAADALQARAAPRSRTLEYIVSNATPCRVEFAKLVLLQTLCKPGRHHVAVL